ncbi:MAG: Type 1 restriction-modification system specificity subunit [Bacteroidota bacterium]|jgi:type I restriction enzyme S subunit|nr:restriction endonuclease subunit S [Burkholderiales bacterium]MBP9768067.1 restriction endonuclease subunit S [Burkholderiales bacterium]MDQ5928654.1 Type 1 restriction-modification system specificity subunit [Bacteroidota bacterium]
MKQGWEIKKLGEACQTGAGGTPLKIHKEYYENGNIPWLRSGEVDKKDITNCELFITEQGLSNSSAQLFPVNTVLVAMYGATAGQVGILRFECSTNQAVCGILPNDKFIPDFLYYKFLCCKDELVSQAVGGAQPNISQIKIKNTLIPVPPLPEQEKIVSILDKVFSAIEQAKQNAEKNLKNAKELFDSYLNSVFANKFTGTTYDRLDSLCELIVDCEHKTAPIQERGIPSIRTPNIGKGVLILDNVNRVSEQTYREWTRRAIPQGGDLILAREAPAGNIAIIPDNMNVCLGQRTVLIRTIKNRIIPKFLAYLILSNNVQRKLLSHSTGATVTHINMKDIRAFKIFDLNKLSEQQEIVQQFEALSAETKQLEVIYQQKLTELEDLKKSILQKAFNGELC